MATSKNSAKPVSNPEPEPKDLTPLSTEQVTRMVFSAYTEGEVEPILARLQKSLAEKGKVTKQTQEDVTALAYGYETETHMALMEGVSPRFRGGAKLICKQLIKDYGCENTAEKVLAETAAIAFVRYLDASRRLNNVLDVDTYITPNKTAYMAMLSKERDRAHRQYLSTLSAIRQHKAPPIEMTIRAKTAFVAANQQINASGAPQENNAPE